MITPESVRLQPTPLKLANLERKVSALVKRIEELEEWKRQHKRKHEFDEDCWL